VGVIAYGARFEQYEQEDDVVSFEKLDEPVHPCLVKMAPAAGAVRQAS
jgi:hypothetical protein